MLEIKKGFAKGSRDVQFIRPWMCHMLDGNRYTNVGNKYN